MISIEHISGIIPQFYQATMQWFESSCYGRSAHRGLRPGPTLLTLSCGKKCGRQYWEGK